jgi:hypothetical protein
LLDDIEQANVSLFALYYRNIDTKKWVHAGTYNGTQSMLVECVINLSQHFNTPQGIYTDSLKFVARNPAELYMRIAVYGIAIPTENKIGSCDTVTYCVEKGSIDGWNFGNYNYTCDCSLCRANKTRRYFRKGKAKRNITMEITDQINASDMSGEFSCVSLDFDRD